MAAMQPVVSQRISLAEFIYHQVTPVFRQIHRKNTQEVTHEQGNGGETQRNRQ